MKLTPYTQEIIIIWLTELHTLQSIADKFSVSRPAIKLLLNNHGYSTARKPRITEFTCNLCGRPAVKPKSRNKYLREYCSQACYKSSMNTSDYNLNRQGQRQARKAVSAVFPLTDQGYVVHHVDNNPMNNELCNLMVFRNQEEHVLFHNGGNIKPVFRGGI